MILLLWTLARTSSPAQATTIEYIAHASFVIESNAGERILIDPYASRVWLGYDFPELPAVDAVVVTHPHYDHDAGRYRGHDWPWDSSVRIFDRPGESSLGSFEILGVQGKHADPYGKEFGQLNTIFRFEVDGVSIVHVGDNGPLTEENFRELGNADILMVPADALEHILKNEEIAAIIEALEPRVVIPMHYRIPELEAEADSPDDLGQIGPWLEGRENVLQVGGHLWNLAKTPKSEQTTIMVFEPSPLVARPTSRR